MFETLMEELEGMVDRLADCCVPADASALVRLAAVADRLAALGCGAQVRFDAIEGWRERGAVSLRGWLRDEGGLSRRAASASAKRSERLEQWTEVAAAWSAGRLTGGQVDAIVGSVPARFVARFADDAAMVVAAIGPLDAERTEVAVAQWVRMAEASDGPEQFRERPSTVFAGASFDGRFAMSVDLAGADGAIVEAALSLFDAPDPVDERGDAIERRTAAQRAGASLVAMAQHALDTFGDGSDRGRSLPNVLLTVDLQQLRAAALRGAGVRDRADLERSAARFGWTAVERAWFVEALDLAGDGVTGEGRLVDSAAVAALCCDSAVQRVLTVESQVLDVGRKERIALPVQRRAIIARDRHCRAPGCRTRPGFCDVHHVDHWALGGRTDVARMVLLCGAHHREFHKPGYRMELDERAVFTVHSPAGWSRSTMPEHIDQTVLAVAAR